MEEINLNCGVYQIRNIVTNYCYDGQSIHLKERPKQHWRTLKNNKHKNTYLQRSYNKWGKEFFIFEILIYCVPEKLTYYEQLFYDINKAHGLSYNVRKCVNSNKGMKHSDESCKRMSESHKGQIPWNKGIPTSEETRKRLSESLKGRTPWNKGIECSEEAKEKISKTKKGQIPWNKGGRGLQVAWNITKKEVVLDILTLLKDGVSVAKIIKKTNVDKSTIYRIKNGYYNKIYNLPPEKWNPVDTKGKNNWRIIKKEIVLQIVKMLNDDISVKNISKELEVSPNTIYKAKKGFYDDIYDL